MEPEDLAFLSGSKYWAQRAEHWLDISARQDKDGNSEAAEGARLVAANCARLWVDHLKDETPKDKANPDWAIVTELVSTSHIGEAEEQVFKLRTADIHALRIFESRSR
ncbi:hypothetical protein [Mycobacterium shigaense]|uniref:hypothetical protein n=1 Tax=Mycobacterium shigaense TaxID=722731 RepID=UPI002ADFBE33|nr:hypothetical protein [Mycobacterium shigaense]MEA1121712.1 hypothetical protein [Mycobacterium shigaense]